jgi:hypothetical protein
MLHKFNASYAIAYGVHESILIEYFKFWIGRNKNFKKNCHDGRTWTYNTILAIQKVFPYFSIKQVRSAIDNLVNHKILVKHEYNRNRFDRTAWYAFSDETQFLPAKETPATEVPEEYGMEQTDPGWQQEIPFKKHRVALQGNSELPSGASLNTVVLPVDFKTVGEEGKSEETTAPVFLKKEERAAATQTATVAAAAIPQDAGDTLGNRKNRFTRRLKDYQERYPAKYPGGLYADFLGYWSQPNLAGTKMKFEAIDFFGIAWRLRCFWRQCNMNERRDYWEEDRMQRNSVCG